MLHRLVVFTLGLAVLVSGTNLAWAQQAAFNPANGHTYKLTPTVADFNAARTAANAEGGYLVAINDAAENQFVLTAFQSFFNAGGTAYIGLTDELTEGIFLWDSGEPLIFSNWNLGQPDDWQAVGGEDYGQMIGNGLWNDNTINALDVGIIEIPIREPARILLAPGATLVRNLSQQTFTINATIVGLETRDGFVLDSPTIEPLVGGTVSISGSFLGGADTLVGVTFGATTLNLSATAGTDELSLIGTYSHNLAVVQDEFKLGGVQGVIPMDRRSLTQAGTPSTTRIGVVSPTLNAIDNAISFDGSSLSLVFEVPFSGDPVLEYIAVDYDPAPTPPQVQMATDGAGSMVVGVIATGSNAELYNLFSPMPATVMPGDGPFFGLDLSPFVLENAMQPLGAIPFHVTADANGAWFWGLPSGSIPPMTIDLVTLAVTGGQISYQSPVQRLVF
jgi:Lectin C-type domain